MFKRLTKTILSNFRNKPDLEQFLEAFFSADEQKVVVQIGANDGIQSDPLCKFLKTPGRYRAILVEPLPYYADRLNQLYWEPGFTPLTLNNGYWYVDYSWGSKKLLYAFWVDGEKKLDPHSFSQTLTSFNLPVNYYIPNTFVK